MKNYPNNPIILIDDEQSVLGAEQTTLKKSGINNILCFTDSREVIPFLEKNDVEVILLDLSMPHITGKELLESIKTDYPEIPVIIITASCDVASAVDCMKLGAANYLVKPVESNYLIKEIKSILEIRKLKREYKDLKLRFFKNQVNFPESFSKIISQNRDIHAMNNYIESIAPDSDTILITGETGTGKELVAEAIFKSSGRTGEFVTINVAGLDDTMFSDTLFGHKSGAYSGARESRKGLIQQAAGGTVFLDEIGDLSLKSQIKLLRLLEAKEYFSLGSDIKKYTDASFILATNRDLKELIQDGLFRKDLYYRLSMHEIELPPLRKRKDDIPLLVDHFLVKASKRYNKEKISYPPQLLTLLGSYSFPGNIRELRSLIFNAVSRHDKGVLSLKSFKESLNVTTEYDHVSAPMKFSFPDKLPSIKEMQELLINEALLRSEGNQTIAAEMIGLTKQALSKRLSRKNNK